MSASIRCFLFAVVFAASVQAKVSVAPVADAYAMNTSTTTNYGSAATLVVNSSNGVRVAWLRFDLSAVNLPATRITLDLFSNGTGFDSFNIYGLISGEDWQESTLRWNNAPGIKSTYTTNSGTLSQIIDPAALYLGGTPLASFSAPGAADARNRAFDVTAGPVHDFIAADADKIVTFLIVEQDPPDNSGLSWHSREAANAALRPTLSFYHTGDTWDHLRVVLLGGQSNMDGRAAGSGLPAHLQQPQENIPFYYHTHGSSANADSSLGQLTTLRPGATQMPAGGFGPEVSLGYHLSRAIGEAPRTRLAIIKYARGGTNLHTQWKAGGDSSVAGDGDVYQTWQRVVRNGVSRLSNAFPDARLDLAAIVWVQAGSDITSSQAASAAYGDNQRAFIHDVRATIRPNLPFYIAKVSDQLFAHSDPSGPNYQNYLLVRAGQETVAGDTAGVHLLEFDGSSYPVLNDGLHFAAGGLVKIGAEYADHLARTIILRSSILPGPTLRWNAIPGRAYQVEYTGDLSSWSRILAGSVSEWTDPAPPARRFYRIAEAD
jgi:hypothetical protein